MKISNEELKSIFFGGYNFGETEDGYLASYQYTKEQMDYLEKASEFWYVRSKAGNAKTLEFKTEATEFSFEYKFLWQGALDSIEVMVDGVVEKIFRGDDLPEKGEIKCNLPAGEKNVVVYLVADTEIVIRNFCINASFERAQKGEKVLWMGDSITQGYGPFRSAHTYVSVANRLLNYEIVNQGIGGFVYDKNILTKMDGYTPDKIIIALGTNQFKNDGNEQIVEEYYERLHTLYGDTPVLCVTALWRPDAGEDSALMEKLVKFNRIVETVCAKYPNIKVVDGFKMISHAQDYFLDAVHPSTLGCEVFGRNLVEEIRKIGF
ncbi:MAG: SGNH/GDSL hydrolase family protein [Clostridia bacterium]|nr:SGNH/GDSL hydrolase family protein [Clostridia bacterium]